MQLLLLGAAELLMLSLIIVLGRSAAFKLRDVHAPVDDLGAEKYLYGIRTPAENICSDHKIPLKKALLFAQTL